ncbi:MAG TPA: hypothetical protein VFC67_11435 [Prolixibacteraceae bacterium]|nr:hypothetical protein [Prolixibacteraceae bacterium]
MSNQISTPFSDEDLDVVLQSINTIRQKLPFLVIFSAAEKKKTAMLDDGRIPFANKALDYASREASISPNPLLLEEAKMDSNLFIKLQSVDRELSRLSEMVSDTRMLAGAELYEFARVVYKMSKISASIGTPGTKSIVDDLGKLYAGNGNSGPAPQQV